MASPAELLDRELVLTLTQVATVLNLRVGRGARKGDPDPGLAHQLVIDGKLRPVDPDQPSTRLTVSCAEVRRYLNGAEVAA